ncbi:MAG: toll/interleukin-1 receptor domain-containing protein [Chloroflexota bacterium]
MDDNSPMLFEGTPLMEPIPTDTLQRVHRLAHDLAWGAANEYWTPRLIIKGNHIDFNVGVHYTNFREYVYHWEKQLPSVHLLTSFGYIELMQQGDVTAALLTEKAFKLLESPLNEPSIFVSYRRRHSTAFALLVEARLRIAGNKNVFVDKMLEIGGEWRLELEERVRTCDYLIVLVGETTFQSEWVVREVELAAENGATIIPIWQPGAARDAHTPQLINDRQEIRVAKENAEAYETAINKLLHRLGYATY